MKSEAKDKLKKKLSFLHFFWNQQNATTMEERVLDTNAGKQLS